MEIRPVVIDDAEAISRIRRQNGVREGILALTSERLSISTDFLKSLTEDDHLLAAVDEGNLAGIVLMLRNKAPQRRHSYALAIMVDREYHGRGIGNALMKRIIEEADNSVCARRLELLVLTDNKPAIELYKKFGFKIEATKRHSAVKDGRFVDEHLMGRINKNGAEI